MFNCLNAVVPSVLDVAWYDRDELARCGTKYLFFHNFFTLSDQHQYPFSMIFSWHVSLDGSTLLTSFSCLGLNYHKIELLSSQELNRTSFQNCLSFWRTSFKTGVRRKSKETLNSLLKTLSLKQRKFNSHILSVLWISFKNPFRFFNTLKKWKLLSKPSNMFAPRISQECDSLRSLRYSLNDITASPLEDVNPRTPIWVNITSTSFCQRCLRRENFFLSCFSFFFFFCCLFQ